MTVSLRHLLGWIVSAFSSREDLILENLALRQQLLTLHATRPRRRLSALHKLFWVALRRFWSGRRERDKTQTQEIGLRPAGPIWPRSFRRGNRREPPGDVPRLRRRLLLMIAGVADTHTARWELLKNSRLSVTARQIGGA